MMIYILDLRCLVLIEGLVVGNDRNVTFRKRKTKPIAIEY